MHQGTGSGLGGVEDAAEVGELALEGVERVGGEAIGPEVVDQAVRAAPGGRAR
ncbi:hypothetical protein GCM10020229_49260 [Kitasatospora albolonga]